ncbi:MAG TPA: type IV toxin-antitoxin system AbiEi family antitoxin domain-containing protein [Candidatus Cloacimonadota bacterium]|nr:type IV toxin-antitoxin system AbiEi family antitoxin domain-containing protein [Candidatus Cloacimonadota bacterium]HOQ81217.1 type IV toxin-antitoxin system AbiEi family antitoxin domain-containing protein [Candidatus Cloacimonadota bacterium]HPK41138.1 type IV toxin-antitoxin system AbiEi family antitoxin domain-containing protein [Candidatus Cloacimonadota bacterium]HPY97414.1 type IV toxin-antitoxin system AbiEi family antitoxin domain-containing protein [Candidatus Cloacimonadota bacter
MTYLKKLKELIKKQKGTVLSADLDLYQIPRIYLQLMVEEGKLERVKRGVYVATDSIQDEMYFMQAKYTKLIYSHETALYLHGLSDRTPFEYSASVPSGYKVVDSVAERFKVYYIKKELHVLGIETLKSSHGNPIKVYNIERTICDLIRSRNRIDIQILNEALKRFVKLKSIDYSKLMAYAKEMRIDSILIKYLEVLL